METRPDLSAPRLSLGLHPDRESGACLTEGWPWADAIVLIERACAIGDGG